VAVTAAEPARPRRRRLPSDVGLREPAAVAPNVLDRSFEACAPNRKWIADFTYVWTAEGWRTLSPTRRTITREQQINLIRVG
jgi:transposase InsO family protein